MSLRFAYRMARMPQPVVSLGGQMVRPRPVLDISIVGPTGTLIREAILDSAADDTIFSEADAPGLGLSLAVAPMRVAAGIGLTPYVVRYAQVALRLSDGREFREWQAWVGFTAARMHRPLLGFAGVLQFFKATFHGDREEVELAVNSLYPGR